MSGSRTDTRVERDEDAKHEPVANKPPAKPDLKILESQVQEPKEQAYDKIAKAKFAIEGTGTYPDATFTLRLSFGPVKGYVEEGKKVPFETTFEGLYAKADEEKNRFPYDLPPRWARFSGGATMRRPRPIRRNTRSSSRRFTLVWPRWNRAKIARGSAWKRSGKKTTSA